MWREALADYFITSNKDWKDYFLRRRQPKSQCNWVKISNKTSQKDEACLWVWYLCSKNNFQDPPQGGRWKGCEPPWKRRWSCLEKRKRSSRGEVFRSSGEDWTDSVIRPSRRSTRGMPSRGQTENGWIVWSSSAFISSQLFWQFFPLATLWSAFCIQPNVSLSHQ